MPQAGLSKHLRSRNNHLRGLVKRGERGEREQERESKREGRERKRERKKREKHQWSSISVLPFYLFLV
jgi:hypothetical protein